MLVGLGLGTPETFAGASEARAAGAGLVCGAAVARAIAALVGEAFGTAGGGVAAFGVGRATVPGAFGEGRAEGALVGTGDGAAVGGGLMETATGPTVGTLAGAAGSSVVGRVSKMFAVGCGFGWGVCCGMGRGFGGAVGANRASSCRLTGRRWVCSCAGGA